MAGQIQDSYKTRKANDKGQLLFDIRESTAGITLETNPQEPVFIGTAALLTLVSNRAGTRN